MASFNVSGYAGPLKTAAISDHIGRDGETAYALLLEFADTQLHVPGLTAADVLRIAKACENALYPPEVCPDAQDYRCDLDYREALARYEARLSKYVARDRNA